MNTPAPTLANCDQEAIHIPGMIQSHGALVAFGMDATLKHHSANAESLLGHLPKLGEHIGMFHFDHFSNAYTLIFDYLDNVKRGNHLLLSYRIDASNQDVYDLVLHVHNAMIIAEFELRFVKSDDANLFSIKSQKAINAVRQQKTIQNILEVATSEIRELTGFDRVMAYRFNPDESGHVRAEAKRPDLDSLLDRRYPASDIPAQARRLYILNTLRLIVDVDAGPVALVSLQNTVPLDLSFSVLRSVSPIHIEYLQNMGVGASMSISIVINNKLWGLIACHHMSPLQVPYSVRMGCDVLCQILGSTVHGIDTMVESNQHVISTTVRSSLVMELLKAEDFGAALITASQQLTQLIPCDAVYLTHSFKHGPADIPEEPMTALLKWLESRQLNFHHYFSTAHMPEDLKSLLGIFTGGLALCIDKINRCWIVFLRKEKIETITWAGFPEKEYKSGPLGPRLTPRGSFEEWKETVKGQSEPWTPADLASARELHIDLMDVCNSINAENEQLRIQLMAILGHDLRDPLHTINMATDVIEKIDGSSRMSQRIKRSSSRMERLINDVMDMVKVQNGIGLGLKRIPTDLHQLIEEVVEESMATYPDHPVSFHGDQATIDIDPDRIVQVINNLLNNCRAHGAPGAMVNVRLVDEKHALKVSVINKGAAIAPDIEKVLFNPFKRQSLSNERNKAGMGLGLFIAKEVMEGHAGNVKYAYDDEKKLVTFELRFER